MLYMKNDLLWLLQNLLPSTLIAEVLGVQKTMRNTALVTLLMTFRILLACWSMFKHSAFHTLPNFPPPSWLTGRFCGYISWYPNKLVILRWSFLAGTKTMFEEIQCGKSGDQGLRKVLDLDCENRNSHDWKGRTTHLWLDPHLFELTIKLPLT